MDRAERDEYLRCSASPAYFIDSYCWIEDKVRREWIPFRLWPAQYCTLKDIISASQVIILKARQLGLTWLLIAYGLWMLLFRPGSGVLLFSRRDTEASDLLSRLKQMHARLPGFLKATVTVSNEHEFSFGELGSVAQSFPTTKHSGRSFTATLAVVDEADFIRWLKQLLNAVKPTVDAGGKLVLLSTIDKENWGSEFKRIWNRAAKGLNKYVPIFLPWTVRPGRDLAWYAEQALDYEEDDLLQEYPITPEEALAPRSSSKRFSPGWIRECRGEREVIDDRNAPALPGMAIWRSAQPERCYLLAADPAEGNPSSNPSAAGVLDAETWEMVARLYGRFEPDVFGDYLVQLAEYYNSAVICVERNNHGHTVHLQITNVLNRPTLLYLNPFDGKDGWLSSVKYKTQAVNNAAQVLREGGCTIHDEATLGELAIFEAATLKAPVGEMDDLAMVVVIGLAALRWPSLRVPGEVKSYLISAVDPLKDKSF